MKRSFLVLAALAAVAVMLGVTMIETLTGYDRHVRNAPWPAGLGSTDHAPSHFRSRAEPTPDALELIRLAEPLGVDFRLRSRDMPPLPQRAEFDAIKQPLTDYLGHQLARDRDGIDAPPQSVLAFLDTHRAELSAVRSHILGSQRIEWPVRMTNFADSPIPNLLGHLELVRIFCADALADARFGGDDAWEDLHAAWQLGAGLRSRPDEISQLIALAMSRMISAAAMHIPQEPPAWFAEVGVFDHGRAILSALQVQAWSWTQLDNPVMRFGGINAADHLRQEAEAMTRTNDCAIDHEARGRAAEASLHRWTVFAKATFANAWSMWSRVARFTAEREATARVVQLLRGAAATTSSRCSDGQWLVTPRSIAFSRDIHVTAGTKYPLRFALSDSRE